MARHFAGLAWLALIGAAVPTITLADDPPSKQLEEVANRAKLAKDALRSTVDAALRTLQLVLSVGLVIMQPCQFNLRSPGVIFCRRPSLFSG